MRKTLYRNFLTLTSLLFFLLISPRHAQAEASDKDAFKQCIVPDLLSNKKTPCYFLLEDQKNADKQVRFASSITSIALTPTPTPQKVVNTNLNVIKKDFRKLNFKPDYTSTLSAEILFNLVNEYRAKFSLPVYERDDALCQLASDRAGELYNEIFVTGRLHSGFYARSLSYRGTENVIYAQSEQLAFNWWQNSYVHRSSMLSDYKYSCCACNGKACTQIFTSFSPKQLLTSNNITVN